MIRQVLAAAVARTARQGPGIANDGATGCRLVSARKDSKVDPQVGNNPSVIETTMVDLTAAVLTEDEDEPVLAAAVTRILRQAMSSDAAIAGFQSSL